jgi:aldehyde:ferredoxin oxidoreductase
VPPIDRARFQEELTKYYRIRGLADDGSFQDPAFLERQP